MILEEQVVSLELAKKLKELGVKQESAFYWEVNLQNKWTLFLVDDFSPRMHPNAAAFTVAELGEMLPHYVCPKYNDTPQYLRIEKMPSDRTWRIQYMRRRDEGEHIEHRTPVNPVCEITEADARAKMLCYLIEQKIVEAK